MRFLLLFIGLILISGFKPNYSRDLSECIRFFVEHKPEGDRYRIDETRLFSSQLLPRFYNNRFFAPAWISGNTLNIHAIDLINTIRQVDKHGLQPEDYHLEQIERYTLEMGQGKASAQEEMMKAEILMTDAFLLLAAHLYFGKVDPEKNDANWKLQRKEPELFLDKRLENAVTTTSVEHELNQLLPKEKNYQIMRDRLAWYRNLEKHDWNPIASGATLKPGDVNNAIPQIRGRLNKLNYKISDTVSNLYDEELEKKVMAFQQRHGLNPDGVIGRFTLQALNISPAERAEMMRVNMERLRWLPLEIPEQYIMVNIANFTMDVIEGRDTLLSSRAIVGRSYRKTPVFTGRMTYLVFSPTWVVPPGILANDVIPAVRKDPDYLRQKNMTVIRFDGSEVDQSTIDWANVTGRNFPYMIRQEPGPDNALGRVKFMFPNQYNVYIHDTPSRNLFSRDGRAFSSGCIRIEKPFEFAQQLLADNPRWDENAISSAMNADRELTVRFSKPWTVVMVYFTSWADAQGNIQFRQDVYDRDAAISVALRKEPDYHSAGN